MSQKLKNSVIIAACHQRIADLITQARGTERLSWWDPDDDRAKEIVTWLQAVGKSYLASRLAREVHEVTRACFYYRMREGTEDVSTKGMQEIRKRVLAAAQKVKPTLELLANLEAGNDLPPRAEAIAVLVRGRDMWIDMYSCPLEGSDRSALAQLRRYVPNLAEGMPYGPVSRNWFIDHVKLAEYASRAIIVALNATQHPDLGRQVEKEYSVLHAALLELYECCRDTDFRHDEHSLEDAERRWEREVISIHRHVGHLACAFAETLNMVESAVPAVMAVKMPSEKAAERGTNAQGDQFGAFTEAELAWMEDDAIEYLKGRFSESNAPSTKMLAEPAVAVKNLTLEMADKNVQLRVSQRRRKKRHRAPRKASNAGKEAPRTAVVLNGPDRPPFVLGKEKPELTSSQYDTVNALLDASLEGKKLTIPQLDHKSGHTDARKFLYELVKKDADWKAVIHLPGKKGHGGYGLNLKF